MSTFVAQDPGPPEKPRAASVLLPVTPADALIELVLTAVLLFVVVTAVWWVFDGPAARGAAGIHVRLTVVGLIVAVTLWALILSPWGRRSGAHANPAVTLALWLMGSFPAAAVPGYLAAQLAGSLLGTGGARLLLGADIAAQPVDYGLARPAPGWAWWQIFLAEAGTVFVILMILGFLLSRSDQRARQLLPYVLPAAVAVVIIWLGPLSGGSGNPARQFGPALFAGADGTLAAYLAGPMLGALAAAGAHRLLLRRRPKTHRLCGTDTPATLP